MEATKTKETPPTASGNGDLLPFMSDYLDVQLVVPMLRWQAGRDLYDRTDVKRRLLDCLNLTDRIEDRIDATRDVRGKDADVSSLETRQQELDKISATFSSGPTAKLLEDGVIASMKEKGTFNLEGVCERFGLKPEDLEALYDYAKFMLDTGKPKRASLALVAYLELVPGVGDKYFHAGWGTLLALILTIKEEPQNSDVAIQMLAHLRKTIDSYEDNGTARPQIVLLYRAWLVHWSLFVFFQREDAAKQICNFFIRPKENRRQSLLTVVQLTCPWVLRYVCAAVIMTTNWKQRMMIVKIVRQESSVADPDPVVRLLTTLVVDSDPKAGKQLLSECERVLRDDFFFADGAGAVLPGTARRIPFLDRFVVAARKMVFRTYCLTHREIEMRSLAEELGMTFLDLEKWTVDLIQAEKNYLLNDVKIDTSKGTAVMDAKHPSIYERIMHRTKDLSMRSIAMTETISQKK